MTFTKKVKALFARKESTNLLSVALRQETVSYCYFPDKATASYNTVPIINDDFISALESLHNVGGLSAGCELILSSKHYQIVQVDKPNLPDNELLAGLKWQVKDLVTIPPEDMVLDYFDGPSLAGVNKLNVVCAQQSKIKNMVNVLHKESLSLKSISTEEFAFSHLLQNAEGAQLLICQQPNEDVLVLIVRDGQLFSYRRLRGMANIGSRSPDELSMGLIDTLSVEIQKSIDFFERQLKQPPVKNINVLLPVENEAFIARKLAENTHVSVELLVLPDEYSNDRSYAAVIGSMVGRNMAAKPATETQA